MFLAYGSNIAAQFEVIQRWLNGANSTGIFSRHNDLIRGTPLRERLLAETLRVLESGGSVHIIDFARDQRQRVFGRKLQGAEMLGEDLAAAGFSEFRVEPHPRWLWQRLVYGEGRCASRPSSGLADPERL
jgi:hypothetical protein